jgi:hypothetical protein
MSVPPVPEEIARWRRYYAIECNNRAWDLAGQETRTPAETEELVHAAHAAAWLWEGIGDELNRARGWMLLGQALGLAGQAAPALDYAGRSLAFFLAHECPDWELAFAHAVQACAAQAAGESALYETHWRRAAELGAAIADPEDRGIFLSSFRLLPAL